jgi:hypothetical protein
MESQKVSIHYSYANHVLEEVNQIVVFRMKILVTEAFCNISDQT